MRFRTVDVQDLFEDSRRAPVSRLAPGYTVYRRPRMAEEGVPANAELVTRWSRRRAARCRTACRWARGRWLLLSQLSAVLQY